MQELSGPLDIPALKRSFHTLLARHQSLRTNFKEIDGSPVQFIHKKSQTKLEEHDLSRLKDRTKQAAAERSYHPKADKRALRLETDPLLRMTIIKKESDKHTLVIVLHHIITDAWSMGIFYRELAALYNGYQKGEKPGLEPLPIQYTDYAVWEQSKENEKRLKKQEKYWLKTLAGDLPVLNLPTDYPRPPIQTYQGAVESIIIDEKTTRQIKDLARANDTTLFTLLFAVFNVFLYRLTGQEDIIVGTFAANRQYQGLESIIGILFNNIALRNKISPHDTFVGLLTRIKITSPKT